MPHDIRLFSDVNSKMTMFDQRAREHRQNQLINPFSEWSGAGTRRKLSRDDPDYGRPVEGSKTAERGKQAQLQMISDMVQLCDFIYDCGIRSPDGRAAIAFGNLFRLYSTINDKCVGLLMRGRRHKILDFSGEMLFQRRDDDKMIELLLPLNTIRHRYGLPERMGAGEIRLDLLEQLDAEEKLAAAAAAAARAKKQRARSLDLLPTGDTEKSSATDTSLKQQSQLKEPPGSDNQAGCSTAVSAISADKDSSNNSSAYHHSSDGSQTGRELCDNSECTPRGRGVWSLTVGSLTAGTRAVSQPDLTSISAGDSSFKSADYTVPSRTALSSPPLQLSPQYKTERSTSEDVVSPDKALFTISEEVAVSGGEAISAASGGVPLVLITQYGETNNQPCGADPILLISSSNIDEASSKETPCSDVTDGWNHPSKHVPPSTETADSAEKTTDQAYDEKKNFKLKMSPSASKDDMSEQTSQGRKGSLTSPKRKERRKSDSTIHQVDTKKTEFPLRPSSSTPHICKEENAT